MKKNYKEIYRLTFVAIAIIFTIALIIAMATYRMEEPTMILYNNIYIAILIIMFVVWPIILYYNEVKESFDNRNKGRKNFFFTFCKIFAKFFVIMVIFSYFFTFKDEDVWDGFLYAQSFIKLSELLRFTILYYFKVWLIFFVIDNYILIRRYVNDKISLIYLGIGSLFYIFQLFFFHPKNIIAGIILSILPIYIFAQTAQVIIEYFTQSSNSKLNKVYIYSGITIYTIVFILQIFSYKVDITIGNERYVLNSSSFYQKNVSQEMNVELSGENYEIYGLDLLQCEGAIYNMKDYFSLEDNVLHGLSYCPITNSYNGRVSIPTNRLIVIKKVDTLNQEIKKNYEQETVEMHFIPFELINLYDPNKIESLDIFELASEIDFNYITSLPNLTALQISSNNIGDKEVQELYQMGNLISLNVSENKISTLQGIDVLKKLESLNVSENNISKMEGMENLGELKELDVSGNNISKMEGMENLGELKELDVSGNNISKMEGMENLGELEELDVSGNNITKIEGIENLNQLTYLNVRGNNISKMEGMENLGELEELDVSGNNITKIEGVENLTELSRIDVSNNSNLKYITKSSYEFIKENDITVLGDVDINELEIVE